MAHSAANNHYAHPDVTQQPHAVTEAVPSPGLRPDSRRTGLSMVRTRAMDSGHVPAGWWCALVVSFVSLAVTYGDIRSVTDLLAYEDSNPSMIWGVSCALGLSVFLAAVAFLMAKRPHVWTRLHVVVGSAALLWGGSCLLAGLRFLQWVLPNHITTSMWRSGQWLGLAVFPLFFTLVLVLPLVALPRLVPAYVHKATMVRLATTMVCIGTFFPFEVVLFGSSLEEVFWLSPFWLFMIAGVLLLPLMVGLTISRAGRAVPSTGRTVLGLAGAAGMWALIFSAGGMAEGPYGLWMMLGPVALVLYIFFVRAKDALFPVEMSALERFARPGGITPAEYDFLIDDDFHAEFVSRARSRAAKLEAIEYLLAARGLAMLARELAKETDESQRHSEEHLGIRLISARAALRAKGVVLRTSRPIYRHLWHSP